MKTLAITIVAALLISFGLVRWGLHEQHTNDISGVPEVTASATPRVLANAPTISPKATATSTPSPTPTAKTLPKTAKLDVSFTSQAPMSVWDALHEDACEEASFLMVKYFNEGKKIASKEEIDPQIIDMVHWEESKGYGKSISLTQLNTIVAEKYGIENGEVVNNITINDIKREIVEGRPVILGMAGKMLANPNFRDGGPVYHMLVVTGYDETGFITNDPGTRLGHNFHYEYAGFDAAIHDWNEANIQQGGRNMLIFK